MKAINPDILETISLYIADELVDCFIPNNMGCYMVFSDIASEITASDCFKQVQRLLLLEDSELLYFPTIRRYKTEPMILTSIDYSTVRDFVCKILINLDNK